MKEKKLVCFFSLIIFLVIVLAQMNPALSTEAIVRRQAKAWETGNVSAIVADFAPDGVFIAGNYIFEGVEAIQQAAEDYFRQFTDTKITIQRVIIEENQGAVEWDWSDRNIQTGKISYAEDAIVFELQADGKISYWREYIEKKLQNN